jgi:hypothetical protein
METLSCEYIFFGDRFAIIIVVFVETPRKFITAKL